jgi:hypothetical protein
MVAGGGQFCGGQVAIGQLGQLGGGGQVCCCMAGGVYAGGVYELPPLQLPPPIMPPELPLFCPPQSLPLQPPLLLSQEPPLPPELSPAYACSASQPIHPKHCGWIQVILAPGKLPKQ